MGEKFATFQKWMCVKGYLMGKEERVEKYQKKRVSKEWLPAVVWCIFVHPEE